MTPGDRKGEIIIGRGYFSPEEVQRGKSVAQDRFISRLNSKFINPESRSVYVQRFTAFNLIRYAADRGRFGITDVWERQLELPEGYQTAVYVADLRNPVDSAKLRELFDFLRSAPNNQIIPALDSVHYQFRQRRSR